MEDAGFGKSSPYHRFRLFMNRFVRWYFTSLVLQMVIVGVTMIAILVAVVESYIDLEMSDALEIFFFIVFAFDGILDFFRAPHKMEFLMSWAFLFDISACLSILTLAFPQQHYLVLFRFLRVFKIMEVFRLRHYIAVESGLKATNWKAGDNSVVTNAVETTRITFEIAALVVNITSFLIICAAVVYVLSITDQNSFNAELTFLNSMYFTIVTVTTVGYGEIFPVTTLAKVATVLTIVVGFSIVPRQIAAVAQAVLTTNEYHEEYRLQPHKKHVLLCGSVDYQLMYRTCLYLLGKTDGVVASNVAGKVSNADEIDSLVITVLSPDEPSNRIRNVLTFFSEKRASWIVGSAKSFVDLRRAKAEEAYAIIILSDFCSSLRSEEDHVFLTTIAVTKYLEMHYRNEQCFKRNGIFGQPEALSRRFPHTIVRLPGGARNRPVLNAMNVDVVFSSAELKYTLLALGSALPGFLACFQALVGSNESRVSADSTNCSVHQVATNCVHPEFSMFLFHQTVRYVYNISAGVVILIAAKRKRNHEVIINPHDTDFLSIGDCSSLFFLAPSCEDAVSVLVEAPDVQHLSLAVQDFLNSEAIDADTSYEVPTQSNNSEWKHDSEFSDPQKALRRNLSDTMLALNSFLIGSQAKLIADPGDALDAEEDVTGLTGSIPSVHAKLNPFIVPASTPGTRTPTGGVPLVVNEDLLRMNQDENLSDHHVVFILNDSSDTAHQIMLPIIQFLKVLKSKSNRDVLILCDRASDLVEVLPDVEQALPGLMQQVHLLQGFPRSRDHQHISGVAQAATVTLLRPSTIKSARPDSNSERSKIDGVASDRNVIITSLNLHLLLESTARTSRNASNEHIHQPFTVTDIVNDGSILFLRHRPASSSGYTSADGRDSLDDELVQAGSVLTQSYLENLLLQSVCYRDIVSFWEAILIPGGENPKRVNMNMAPSFENKSLSPQTRMSSDSLASDYADIVDLGHWVDEEKAEGKSRPQSRPPSPPNMAYRGKSSTSGTSVDSEGCGPRLERLPLPRSFAGKPFQLLFRHLYDTTRCLAFGIYRQACHESCAKSASSSHTHRRMAYSITCPQPFLTLRQSDLIFVFTCSRVDQQ